MNSFVSNPTAGQLLARQTIQDRVQDAERRAQVRAARAARRTARRQGRATGATPPETRALPWLVFRFPRAAN